MYQRSGLSTLWKTIFGVWVVSESEFCQRDMKLQRLALARSLSGSSSKGKLLSTGQRLKEAVSSQAYQVRLVSIFLLLPRLSRLLFLLGFAIINLQPPFAQEQKESVRSGLSLQSIIPPSFCCAPTQQSISSIVLVCSHPAEHQLHYPGPACTCTPRISSPGQELQGC